MKISKVLISNYRKLNNCSITFNNQKAIIVGSNNSGKTSVMDCLKFFLGADSTIKASDFPLNKTHSINSYFNIAEQSDTINQVNIHDFYPTLEIHLDEIKEIDLPKIKHLIPSLSWNTDESIAVRLVYEPKDEEELRGLFNTHIQAIQDLKDSDIFDDANSAMDESLFGFLKEASNFTSNFTIKAYLVDLENGSLSELDSFPFKNIFKVSKIDAQRGFDDINDSNNSTSDLSTSVSGYYDKHINHKTAPTNDDLEAIQLINKIQKDFNLQLGKDFEPILQELSKLGYPSSHGNPNIKLKSEIDTSSILKKNTSLTFDVGSNTSSYEVPEQQNGLGYRNLIFIFFQLLKFRDDWQKQSRNLTDNIIEPIHLVLIEEPEAYLHSQAQQIFIKKFFDILNKEVDDNFTTQTIVSTHSSYIAHEIGFDSLIYLKRQLTDDDFPCSETVDVSTVFSGDDGDVQKTKKFVSRYLRILHCDLFFADAVIMVEGSAERMLIPHFINNKYPTLSSKYLSILEVGGAYAHKFKPLIEALEIPTLVITDLDSKEEYTTGESNDPKTKTRKIRPERHKGYYSNCDELTHWLPLESKDLDTVLDLADEDKVINNTRIAFQKEIDVEFTQGSGTVKAIPYTFEDALVLSNFQLFKGLGSTTGMLGKMSQATDKDTIEGACIKMFEVLNSKHLKKAVMALDILYHVDIEKLTVPNYIHDGLIWLENQLEPSNGGSDD